MVRLTANPEAEAQIVFDVVKPVDTQMRVVSIEEKDSKATPGNRYWSVRAEYVNPQGLEKLDGTGFAQNPGTIIDNSLVVFPAEKQGKIRAFVESLGAVWADLESEQLIGAVFTARLGLDEYQGVQRNIIARYLPRETAAV